MRSDEDYGPEVSDCLRHATTSLSNLVIWALLECDKERIFILGVAATASTNQRMLISSSSQLTVSDKILKVIRKPHQICSVTTALLSARVSLLSTPLQAAAVPKNIPWVPFPGADD